MEVDNYWENWMRRRMSRRAMLRRAGVTGLALAGGSALWGCQTSTPPKASEPAGGVTPGATAAPTTAPTAAKAAIKRGGTLRIGVNRTVQPENLDPPTYFVSTNDVYLRALHDWLVNHDDSLAYTPARSLAESWDVVDETTLVFKLRKGVKFHDGTEWNSQVLKAQFDRIADPATKSPRAYVIKAMKSVDYPDNYTCKVVLNQPMASILGEFAMAGFGMVSPANVAKWDPKELPRHPGGSGPFTMSDYVPDDHFTLPRNKDYWLKDDKGEQLPFVDALKFVVIPDDTVRLSNLRTGEIDADINTLPKDVEKIKQDPNLKVIIQDGISVQGMYWNLARPPMNNLNFRLAVTHAINREALVKVVTFGLAKPFVSIVLPSAAWAFDPKLDVPKYDPVKAKQYLDQAIAQGVKPELTSYAAAGATMQAAQMVQADLAKIGIKFNLVPDEVTTASYRFWTSFETDTYYGGYAMTPDPVSKMLVAHHSTGLYTPEKKTMGKDWDTPEGYFAKLDPLIEAANKTYDPKKRADLVNQAGKVLADNVGYVGTHYAVAVMTVNKKVEGASWGGDGKGRFERAWING